MTPIVTSFAVPTLSGRIRGDRACSRPGFRARLSDTPQPVIVVWTPDEGSGCACRIGARLDPPTCRARPLTVEATRGCVLAFSASLGQVAKWQTRTVQV